jgi:hypothetical protein
MTRDSGSRRDGRDVQQARGEARQSGGGTPYRPIDHRRFDCMAEYAGECWANALRAPGFHASHDAQLRGHRRPGFNPISQGEK